jgi:uncharacterized phage-associated protein
VKLHVHKNMNSIDAAKYILAYADCKGDLITNKKLQKLLYYVQAWHLVFFKDPLFDEGPQAWRHGPVYPNVYHYFKEFRYDPISLKKEYERTGLNCEGLMVAIAAKNNLNKDQENLIEEVLLKYGRLSAFTLEVLSHDEKPWVEQREGLSEFDRGEKVIPFDSMKNYYSSKLKKSA